MVGRHCTPELCLHPICVCMRMYMFMCVYITAWPQSRRCCPGTLKLTLAALAAGSKRTVTHTTSWIACLPIWVFDHPTDNLINYTVIAIFRCIWQALLGSLQHLKRQGEMVQHEPRLFQIVPDNLLSQTALNRRWLKPFPHRSEESHRGTAVIGTNRSH